MLARRLGGPKVIAWLAVSGGHDEAEPFDSAVHLDRYLIEGHVLRLAENADAARSTWDRLVRTARRRCGEGEDDLFDPGLAEELDTLIFEVMQTAEIAWKLLDDANLDYSRRLEAHVHPPTPTMMSEALDGEVDAPALDSSTGSRPRRLWR